ncbi:unnamed protein product [Auanema sp. JU1783]|nr:unnamed protein product [Auanema sp. JU1783]
MSSCAVCGDRVYGNRYKAPACLGCIVFFRRSVCREAKYKCLKGKNCVITSETRCICRYCRLQKCLLVGMSPEAIHRRDIMGPRKKKVPSVNSPSDTSSFAVDTPSTSTSIHSNYDSPAPANTWMLDQLVKLQSRQRSQHYSSACMMEDTIGCGSDIFDKIYNYIANPPFRRARKKDVNFMLRIALMNASEWALQFVPFKNLNMNMQKSILLEYGFAFLLVDQGWLTSELNENFKDLWVIQNNTYMSPDYLKGLPEVDCYDKEVPTKVKLHPIFVRDALDSVGKPMRELQIDEYETAVLKTLLLLSHKYIFGAEHDNDVNHLQERITSELMQYCKRKNPRDAAVRMGSILLLISGVRCAIRSLYNQLRVSDVFNFMEFHSLIRDVYLT